MRRIGLINRILFSTGKLHMVKLFLLIGCYLYITNIQGQTLYKQYPDESFIVVIDPGHGGKDLGCHGHDYTEKQIALELSKKIGEQLNKKNPSIEIIFTRASDVFMSLDSRIEMAHKYNADLFISVHANSIDIPGISGSETYVFGPHLNEKSKLIEQRENASARQGQEILTFQNNAISDFILSSTTKNQALNKSIQLAESIENNLSMIPTHKSRGVKQANFTVLKDIRIPCVLFEAGYLTNTNDLHKLSTQSGQKEIADRVAEGITTYLRSQHSHIASNNTY